MDFNDKFYMMQHFTDRMQQQVEAVAGLASMADTALAFSDSQVEPEAAADFFSHSTLGSLIAGINEISRAQSMTAIKLQEELDKLKGVAA